MSETSIKRVDIVDATHSSSVAIGADAQNVDVGVLSDSIVKEVVYGYKIDNKFYEQNSTTSTEIVGEINKVYLDLNNNQIPYIYNSSLSTFVEINDFEQKKLHNILAELQDQSANAVSWEEQNILGAKNFIPIGTTQTSNGITFTVNSDGSIKISGIATNTAVYTVDFENIINEVCLFTIDYLSGSSIILNNLSVRLENNLNQIISPYFNNGNDGSVELSIAVNSNIKHFVITVANGANFSIPATIKPMLRLASIKDRTYIPYTMTNKQLTDKINNLHSAFIDLDDVNINSSTLASGNTPIYNSTTQKWENKANTFANLNDVNINNSTLANNQVPQYNASSGKWENKTLVIEDTKVTQTETTTNANYEILLSESTGNTTKTEKARKTNKLTFNPNSGTVSATKANLVSGINCKNEDSHYIHFGIDENGNWGYYKDGADSVTPFKNGIPNEFYMSNYYNGYFRTAFPILTIQVGQSFAIPVGGEGKCLRFTLDSSGTLTMYNIAAGGYIKSVTENETVISATAITGINTTYGLSIIGLYYIDADRVLMLYNWRTSATARSITYARIFGFNGEKMFVSNADSSFAASINEDDGVAGFSYTGHIFKSDFNGNGNKLGIAYLRHGWTSANVENARTLWHGYYAAYVTTSTNYISIAKAFASILSIVPSQANTYLSYKSGKSGNYIAKITNSAGLTSYYYCWMRDSASTTGAIGQFLYNNIANMPQELGETQPLGKLYDDTEVFFNYSNKILYFYKIYFANANNTAKFRKINTCAITGTFNSGDNLILLNGNILLDKNNNKMYQIIYDSEYKLELLGNITVNMTTTNSVVYGSAKVISPARPNGLYSDVFYNIGTKLQESKPTISNLSQERGSLAATTVGDYALFSGGAITTSDIFNIVDAYDSSLTKTTPTALSQARHNLAATTVGSYALFGGGGGTENSFDTVDAYYFSLTRTIPTALSQAKRNLAATTVGGYALFGGGRGSSYFNTVDAYNFSLIKTIPTALSRIRAFLTATTVGDYALFGGGYINDTVDAYNSSLTRTIPTTLSQARAYLAATTVGNYALFGGGYNHNEYLDTVDAYNSSLTRITPTVLSKARAYLAATTVGNYALFGGGESNEYFDTVDVYNSSLTRTTSTVLSLIRSGSAATTVSGYALFGGGHNDTGCVDVVDGYTI